MFVRRWLSISAALFTALVWAALLARVVRYPDNHVGYNVLRLAPLFAGVAGVGLLRRLDRLGVALLLAGLLSIVLVVCLYTFDILVPYEVWLKRGMPPRPF